MIKGTTGVLSASVIWLCSALAAEAQTIDVSGITPTSVFSDQSSMTVTAAVANAAVYNYWVKVKVNGVQKYYSGTKSGVGVLITQVVSGMQAWPIAAGNTMDIIVKAWTSSSNYDTATLTLVIQQGGGTYLPAERRFGGDAYAWLDRKSLGVEA